MALRAWVVASRVVGVLTVAAFLLVILTPVSSTLADRFAVPADIGPAEAIVVLGASAHRDGTLSEISLRRAVAGMQLYHQGLAPRLVFLGMAGEAEARERLAVTFGVPKDAIVTEGHEPTTRAEAQRMGVVLGERLGVRTVLLVTDVFHMRRARALFERAGLRVRPAPTATYLVGGRSPGSRLQRTQLIAQELVALVYHKAFGYL
jgi:uncharacterized SAM-binding protein YcdF (DUF218 family)